MEGFFGFFFPEIAQILSWYSLSKGYSASDPVRPE